MVQILDFMSKRFLIVKCRYLDIVVMVDIVDIAYIGFHEQEILHRKVWIVCGGTKSVEASYDRSIIDAKLARLYLRART